MKSIQDFALINDEIVFISHFRHLVGEKDRPIAHCPVDNCGEEMTMVLPKDESIRRSHFRHISKSLADHSPESIWHAGVKYHLAQMLRQNRHIHLNWCCQSGFCKGEEPLPSKFLKEKPNYIDIDHKKIEKFLPDITLYKDTKPLAVIEIFNTHMSSDEKIDFYNEQKIPWFELKVQSPEDYQEITNWTGGAGLQKFISRMYYPDNWAKYCQTCDEILKEEERKKRLASEQAKKLAEKKQRDINKQLRREKQKENYIAQKKLFKKTIAEKIINYLKENKSIRIDFAICMDCKEKKPLYFSPSGFESYDIDYQFSKFNSYLRCDIALIGQEKPSGFILIKDNEDSKNDHYNSSVKKSLYNLSIATDFIEIIIKKNNNSFTVVDFNKKHHHKENYICEKCQKLRECNKKQQEYDEIQRKNAWKKQYEQQEKIRRRYQCKEIMLIEKLRPVFEKNKQEKFIKNLQQKRIKAKEEIDFFNKAIASASSEEEKIQLRMTIARLNADLKSYNKSLADSSEVV